MAAPINQSFSVTPSDRPTSPRERSELLSSPRFGVDFTDHMVRIDWTDDSGWHDPRVTKLEPLNLHPAAAVFHYGQEIFEGLKIYRHPDGALRSFRPDANAARFQRSAERLAMPPLPASLFLESIEQLAAVDADWVPAGEGTSLYLRPFMIATETFLGIRPARAAMYGLIASPSGAYFESGAAGLRLWLSSSYSRAGAGGTGEAKCGGNYAASLAAQLEAHEHGCQQVLFTDAATHQHVEEAGAMNVFCVIAGTVVTPPLDGTILEGVTRNSVLELAKATGLRTQIRPLSIEEWRHRVADGSLTEAFAAGTAAGIVTIDELIGEGVAIKMPPVGPHSVTQALRDELLGVQYGKLPDRHGWMRTLRTS